MIVQECTENIEEVKPAGITLFEHGNVCKCSYIIYVVLIAIIFTIDNETGTSFVYSNTRIAKKKILSEVILSIKKQIVNINRNIKEIIIKNQTYHVFNDMINIEDFDSSLLKIDKKSCKKIVVYNIRYIATKKTDDYENIHSVNPLYLMIGKVDGFIEEKNGSKYLVFDYTHENKEVFTRYTELWDGIKNQIETINGGKAGEYGKDFIKIKFGTDDDLPLNKPLKFPTMAIVVDLFLKKMVNFIHKFIYMNVCMSYKIIQYKKIYVSEEIDTNKTSASRVYALLSLIL